MKNDIIYAVRDEDTGKLVSDITSKHKKFWTRRSAAECAVRNTWKRGRFKVVAFKLVEVSE